MHRAGVRFDGVVELPFFACLLVYVGTEPWPELRSLALLTRVPEPLRPRLRRYLPDEFIAVLDLHRVSPRKLTRRGLAMGWALRLLQVLSADADTFLQGFREVVTGTQRLPHEQFAEWRAVIWVARVVAIRRPEGEYARLEGLMGELLDQERDLERREEGQVMGRTIADYLRGQGRAQGFAEGEAVGLRRGVLRVLRRRFPVRLEELTDALAQVHDAARLEAAFEAVLDEPDAAAVLAAFRRLANGAGAAG